MHFHYDWWFGDGLADQIEQAKRRCLNKKFPDAQADVPEPNSDADKYYRELEHRVIVYLRDGFTYELGRAIDATTKSYLMAECIPGDEAYKAGTFVVSIPFEEISRVEVFAVHPSQRPQEAMQITGFHARPEP